MGCLTCGICIEDWRCVETFLTDDGFSLPDTETPLYIPIFKIKLATLRIPILNSQARIKPERFFFSRRMAHPLLYSTCSSVVCSHS